MTTPSVHLVPVDLHLMRSDHRNEIVGAQDFFDGVQAEFDRAFTLWVRTEAHLSCIAVIHRIRPKKVTKEALERWFDKSIDLIDVRLVAQLGRDSTMHAKIVTVNISGDWHGLEAADEALVDFFVVELL